MLQWQSRGQRRPIGFIETDGRRFEVVGRALLSNAVKQHCECLARISTAKVVNQCADPLPTGLFFWQQSTLGSSGTQLPSTITLYRRSAVDQIRTTWKRISVSWLHRTPYRLPHRVCQHSFNASTIKPKPESKLPPSSGQRISSWATDNSEAAALTDVPD